MKYISLDKVVKLVDWGYVESTGPKPSCFGSQEKKSRLRETSNLSTDADSSTTIFVSAGVKKGAHNTYFLPKFFGGFGGGGGSPPIRNTFPFIGLHAPRVGGLGPIWKYGLGPR